MHARGGSAVVSAFPQAFFPSVSLVHCQRTPPHRTPLPSAPVRAACGHSATAVSLSRACGSNRLNETGSEKSSSDPFSLSPPVGLLFPVHCSSFLLFLSLSLVSGARYNAPPAVRSAAARPLSCGSRGRHQWQRQAARCPGTQCSFLLETVHRGAQRRAHGQSRRRLLPHVAGNVNGKRRKKKEREKDRRSSASLLACKGAPRVLCPSPPAFSPFLLLRCIPILVALSADTLRF